MNMPLMIWSAVWFMADASALLGFGMVYAATPDAQCEVQALQATWIRAR